MNTICQTAHENKSIRGNLNQYQEGHMRKDLIHFKFEQILLLFDSRCRTQQRSELNKIQRIDIVLNEYSFQIQ